MTKSNIIFSVSVAVILFALKFIGFWEEYSYGYVGAVVCLIAAFTCFTELCATLSIAIALGGSLAAYFTLNWIAGLVLILVLWFVVLHYVRLVKIQSAIMRTNREHNENQHKM